MMRFPTSNFAIWMLLFGAGIAAGQDPPAPGAPLASARQEEPVVVIVTATRREEARDRIPGLVEAIEDAAISAARGMQDSLRRVPGVMLQRTSAGQVSPYLRGMTGYHSLLLLDGIRLNNSILRSGPNEYWGLLDSRSLDRIEAVLGPASVLHGSDAVGGAVQGIPRRRRDFESGNAFDRTISMRYSSAERSLLARGELSGVLDGDLGFVIGGTLGWFGDLEAGGSAGRQRKTGFDSQFGDLALDLRLSDRWILSLLGRHGRLDDVERTHATIHGKPFRGTIAGSDLRRRFDWSRQLLALSLEGEELDGFADSARATVSYQRLAEREDRIRGNGTRNIQGIDVETWGAQAELASELPFGSLTYGFDYYRDVVDSFRNNFDATGAFAGSAVQGPVGDDASYDLAGIYVHYEMPLDSAFRILAGVRATYADLKAGMVADPVLGSARVSDDWWSVVGSARFVWDATSDVQLFGGASQAFRAPNLSDVSRLDSALSNELEIPSSGLDPERFLSLELGTRIRLDDFRVGAAFSYTIIDDLIIRQPTGAAGPGGEVVVAKRNGGDGHVMALDVAFEKGLGEQWDVFGGFSWVDGRAEAFPSSDPVRRPEALGKLSPFRGHLGAGWHTEDRRWQFRIYGVAAARQDRLNSQDRRDLQRIPPDGTPGWFTLNADAAFEPSPGQRYFLAVENILDKNYRLHGAGVQEPGLNVIAGFSVTF